ncbi:DedA family protein/thiosulfate sulfurtransferase GlpE [Lysobacter arenosi]|uniref:DedA family protein/thiosulfate sulfurtransferase GlpE n=1 Tax=Lysobacter arenosi TaxID=2795387 RepID=A0ABX7RC34_9GAMM|nr:DedA family protein/thiosulfate sulfurtransferase GlpE [Lysobacter arenosi]QSX75585.1 DedA family protein/thiosulfate sulfurtransferase GlpE [Lysobacter arenosi]
METLLHLIAVYGLLVVFVSVFLDQGGIPVPAYPPIILTAALAVDRGDSVWPILIVSTLAAVMADWLWFVGGRRLGAKLLRLMCRLSLSPDSCVLMTRGVYSRWGAPSLIVAKFIPGFAAVATTLAGETGTRTGRFLFYDGIGALLWSGLAVALGAIFHEAVNSVLEQLEDLGRFALPAILILIAVFVLWKLWRRQMFLRQLRMARITPMELRQLIDEGTSPLILDVRPEPMRNASGWIPGAVFVRTLGEAELLPRDEVVVYCDCPNEASAAVLARELNKHGFKRVRPLAGGFEGWRSEGNQVAFE